MKLLNTRLERCRKRCRGAQVADWVVDVDAVASAVNDDVAEGRVADGVITQTADADALAAVEDAVGDGHVFAEGAVVARRMAHRMIQSSPVVMWRR